MAQSGRNVPVFDRLQAGDYVGLGNQPGLYLIDSIHLDDSGEIQWVNLYGPYTVRDFNAAQARAVLPERIVFPTGKKAKEAEQIRAKRGERRSSRLVPEVAEPASKPLCAPTERERATSQEIRAWARKKGLAVAERGRVPLDIVEAFKAR